MRQDTLTTTRRAAAPSRLRSVVLLNADHAYGAGTGWRRFTMTFKVPIENLTITLLPGAVAGRGALGR
jgi:hypothetical protein